jgi:hypothetical protein
MWIREHRENFIFSKLRQVKTKEPIVLNRMTMENDQLETRFTNAIQTLEEDLKLLDQLYTE